MIKKIKVFFGRDKTVKIIDILVLIIAIIGFFLIIGKPLYTNFFAGDYPINTDWVVVIMMTLIILLYGLKMLGGKSAGAGFQLIIMAIVIIMLALFLGIVRKFFIN